MERENKMLAETRTVVMSKAAFDVLNERNRQIEQEGWTPEHDDREHCAGDLAEAGAAYADAAGKALFYNLPEISAAPFEPWPFDRAWWKASSPRRALVKAAALIIAEIDRIDRGEARKEGAA